MGYTPPVGPDGKPIQDDAFVAAQQAQAKAEAAAEAARAAAAGPGSYPRKISGDDSRLEYNTKEEAIAAAKAAEAAGKFVVLDAATGSPFHPTADGFVVHVEDKDPNPPLEVIMGSGGPDTPTP